MKLQKICQDTWEQKYKSPKDADMEGSFERVAIALAAVEKENKGEWYNKFLWAMENGAIPAGRIMSNAGAEDWKPNTSTINCVVSDTIEDSIEGIMEAAKRAAITLKSGAGIGYDFSTIRPRGAKVAGAGAYTSGAITFMDIFDVVCGTISSSGGRRGAQLGALDVSHPDIEEFIEAKRESGRLRKFNLSVLITDDFMDALNNDRDWDLHFDGKIYKTVKAKDLWDKIMTSAYNYAEPGVLMIDEINRKNNLYFCEVMRTTNPCGEICLAPNGCCLLGSINLARLVTNPFTDEASFDFTKYKKIIRIFTRMLDNVVEINNLPLQEQRDELERKRRHGMGVTGLATAMCMLKMKYGSDLSIDFADMIFKHLAVEGFKEGVSLAEEKGAAPIMSEKFRTKDGWKTGKELFCESEYLKVLPKGLLDAIKTHGSRFSHHSAVAPTGTISLSFGGNCSSGIEPTFAHEYTRNVIKEGRKTKASEKVYSYEWMLYKELNPDADINNLPDYFITTDDLTPEQHLDIQSIGQKWIDSSISKTINIDADTSFDDFKDIYAYGIKKGLKGITAYRPNPEYLASVLVRDKDLENTTYRITLADGSVIKAKGNEEIEYEGETHTAQNLYDALREGQYGKL